MIWVHVSNPLFAYEYLVNGGIASFHCSEIAFVFHNLSEPQMRMQPKMPRKATHSRPRSLTPGSTLPAQATHPNPASTGNPFRPADIQTMVSDTASECRNIHPEELNTFLLPLAQRV